MKRIRFISLITIFVMACLLLSGCNLLFQKTYNYTVNYYRQNIEDDGYSLYLTDSYAANNGSYATIRNFNDYGFILNESKSPLNYADGIKITNDNQVIDFYYDRCIYTITFNLMGGFSSNLGSDFSVTGKYEAPVQMPDFGQIYLEGFIFTGWDKELPEKYNGDCFVCACYEVDPNYQQPGEDPEPEDPDPEVPVTKYATYKIIDNYESLEDESVYESTERTPFEGVVGEKTNVYGSYQRGFTIQPVEQQIIKEDGSTVVNVYYKRNTYTYTFKLDDETVLTSITGKYGSTQTTPEAPSRKGYQFRYWSQNISSPTFTISDGDWEIIARWEKLSGLSIEVTLQNTKDVQIEYVKNGTEYTFTLIGKDDERVSVYWERDNGGSLGCEKSCTVDFSNYLPGTYIITALVYEFKTQLYYSAAIELKIGNEE